jgi:hypothetical protein
MRLNQTRIAHWRAFDGRLEHGCTAYPLLGFTCSAQASAEHLEQCAELLPLHNRGFGPLAVTVLAIPLARRAAATLCAAV